MVTTDEKRKRKQASKLICSTHQHSSFQLTGDMLNDLIITVDHHGGITGADMNSRHIRLERERASFMREQPLLPVLMDTFT